MSNPAPMSAETWRAIPGTGGMYEASDAGRVRSVARVDACGRSKDHRVLSLHTNRRGYQNVAIFMAGKRSTFTVHRLVMLAFVGPRPEGMDVAHSDGNPANNRLSNLRYATRRENEEDKDRHGTRFIAAGTKNGQAKLSEDAVREIRRLLDGGLPQRRCAEMFGVDQSTVSQIRSGKHWRHMTEANNV